MSKTPMTREGLEVFDHLPAAEAIVMAWNVPGPAPRYHRDMKILVKEQMPVLARAIERLTEDRMRS